MTELNSSYDAFEVLEELVKLNQLAKALPGIQKDLGELAGKMEQDLAPLQLEFPRKALQCVLASVWQVVEDCKTAVSAIKTETEAVKRRMKLTQIKKADLAADREAVRRGTVPMWSSTTTSTGGML